MNYEYKGQRKYTGSIQDIRSGAPAETKYWSSLVVHHAHVPLTVPDSATALDSVCAVLCCHQLAKKLLRPPSSYLLGLLNRKRVEALPSNSQGGYEHMTTLLSMKEYIRLIWLDPEE